MKRILVINPFGIGDVIFSMQATRALRETYPDAFIGFLCNERTAELIRMNQDINETFTFNRDLFRNLLKTKPLVFLIHLRSFLVMLKNRNFDTSVDFSLGREYGFFSLLLGIKTRIGLDYKSRGFFLTYKKKINGYDLKPVAETQLDLLSEAGIPIQQNNFKIPLYVPEFKINEIERQLKKEFGTQQSFVGIAPGGGKSWGKDAHYKQWDPDRFAEAASRLAKNYGANVLIFGSPDERLLLEEVRAKVSGSRLICQDDFGELCAFLSKCKVFLANDGGLAHLADTLGVNAFTIFGPVDEKVYAPYSVKNRENVIFAKVNCRPCYKKFYFPACAHQKQCLTKIEVGDVLDRIKK